MMPSSIDLKEIASRGGGMIIDGTALPVIDLKEIASRASGGGGLIIIRNAGQLNAIDIKEIASRSDGKIIFDFFE
jgi:hypothetical protein